MHSPVDELLIEFRETSALSSVRNGISFEREMPFVYS